MKCPNVPHQENNRILYVTGERSLLKNPYLCVLLGSTSSDCNKYRGCKGGSDKKQSEEQKACIGRGSGTFAQEAVVHVLSKTGLKVIRVTCVL